MTAFRELPEAGAQGRIAEIYGEIRTFYGVPYVSSLQRHLATMPGMLEWAWEAVRPAFVSGALPETAWRLAAEVELAPLPRLSSAALRLLGVDAETARIIRNVCLSFETVAPLNMAMGGCIRALLQEQPAGRMRESSPGESSVWRPPHVLPPPPATLALDAVSPEARAVLLQLAADMDGETFVPGLYRQLAHWPGYLAHAATVLGQLFNDHKVTRECQRLRERIDAATPDLLADLPEPSPLPGDTPVAHIFAAIETYQRTSPQMICFGRLLREALPGQKEDARRCFWK